MSVLFPLLQHEVRLAATQDWLQQQKEKQEADRKKADGRRLLLARFRLFTRGRGCACLLVLSGSHWLNMRDWAERKPSDWMKEKLNPLLR
jgi:hypothetical protein